MQPHDDGERDRETTGLILGRNLDRAVFVLSTGRTATKALAQYFDDCYRQVTARHEPAPSRVLRVASHMRLAGRIRPETMRRMLVACRYPAVERLDGGIYMEANWYLLGFLDVLDRAFENVRVVHITRDPGAYITSMMNFSHLNRAKALAAPRVPYWTLKPEHLSNSAERNFRQMSPPEHYAWLWAAMNAHLDKGAEFFGERYLRIRYEDLFEGDVAGLARLAEWLGLGAVPQLAERVGNRVHASRDRGFGGLDGTNGAMTRMVETYCGEQMTRYGYELPRP